MKKKYAKPIDFKRAIKELIDIIIDNNEITSNNNNWKSEVIFAKQSIDPKDSDKFDEAVSKLEFAGKEVAACHADLTATLVVFDRISETILKGIK
jgi:hypothetical protein